MPDEDAHRVAHVDEIPESGGLVVDVAGKEIAIFSIDDEYYGLANVCTHQGGPLGEGKVEGGCVYCPWHGHQFDIRTGEHGQIGRLNTRTFDVEERDGDLFVYV